MASSLYKEKILEELRILHAKEKMLYEILQDVNASKKEKKDGKGDTDHR